MDDTRMDLSQLEDSGTGRSVPSTPLQVSPQDAEVGGGAEVGQSSSEDPLTETNNNTHLHIPSITVTTAPPSSGDLEDVSREEEREGEEQVPEVGVPDAPLHDQPDMDPEEIGDGVSSEGEKAPAVMEEAEEGREAEATESATVPRGSGTARRSSRAGAVRGRPTRTHTPIVWDDQPASAAATSVIATRGSTPLFPRGRTITIPNRIGLLDPARGVFRGRPRRSRAPFHFQARFS